VRCAYCAGKLAVLHRLLVKLHERDHRVVLFSQFTMMLGILEDYLSQAGFE
jgi:SNF2 family DNA or RNA helicase